MKRQRHKSNQIVIVGPSLASVGGVSSYTSMVMSRIGDRAPKHVSVWAPGRTQSSGWGLRDVIHHLALLCNVALIARRAAVVHVMVTSAPTALARELSVILIARLTGGNVLGHFHGGRFEFHVQRRRTYRWMLRATLRSVSGGAVLSQTMLRDFLTLSPAIKDRMTVLENPVDDAFFAIRKETRPVCGPFRILCLGEVSERKGQLELMEVVDRLDNPARLVLGGPISPPIKKQFEGALSLSQRTRYVGSVKGESLLALFRDADCFCLFSSGEALPISILEAMASGVPVVSTSVGAVPSVVTPDIGVIVAPGDQKALSQALCMLQADRMRCLTMGTQAALKARERFSLTEHIEKLSSVYDHIAEAS